MKSCGKYNNVHFSQSDNPGLVTRVVGGPFPGSFPGTPVIEVRPASLCLPYDESC